MLPTLTLISVGYLVFRKLSNILHSEDMHITRSSVLFFRALFQCTLHEPYVILMCLFVKGDGIQCLIIEKVIWLLLISCSISAPLGISYSSDPRCRITWFCAVSSINNKSQGNFTAQLLSLLVYTNQIQFFLEYKQLTQPVFILLGA